LKGRYKRRDLKRSCELAEEIKGGKFIEQGGETIDLNIPGERGLAFYEEITIRNAKVTTTAGSRALCNFVETEFGINSRRDEPYGI